MHKKFNCFKRQAGLSLVEALAVLLIAGIVAGAAMAMWNSADGTQKGNQMQQDVVALRAALKGMYNGQGGFGTGNVNGVLKSSNKIPSDLNVDSSTPPVITHSIANGTVTVTGAGSTFTIAVTNIPTDVCVSLLTTGNSGWSSIQVGSAAAITSFPISPVVASNATNCAASNSNTVTFTGS